MIKKKLKWLLNKDRFFFIQSLIRHLIGRFWLLFINHICLYSVTSVLAHFMAMWRFNIINSTTKLIFLSQDNLSTYQWYHFENSINLFTITLVLFVRLYVELVKWYDDKLLSGESRFLIVFKLSWVGDDIRGCALASYKVSKVYRGELFL